MDALETLFTPITAILNRQIRAKTPARELCTELDGRVFAIRVKNTALAACYVIAPDQVTLTSTVDSEPDVIISGSLLSLAQLAKEGNEDLFRDGSVELTGDAILAQPFRKLLHFARPDLEEELSSFVGDAAAHNIGNVVRDVTQWSRSVRQTMAQNFSEFLQEESRTVPGRHETDEFQQDVGALRDDVARFEARLNGLEEDYANKEST